MVGSTKFLMDRKKNWSPSNFLSKNLINGNSGMDWCKRNYCKTWGTTPVPGVKDLANQRPVFGHMPIELYIEGFIDTHI